MKRHSLWTLHCSFTETCQIWNYSVERQKLLNAANVSRNSPTVYIRCSKCPPFARIHLRSWPRHWFTALSIMFWSKRRLSSINRSFRWSTTSRTGIFRGEAKNNFAASAYVTVHIVKWQLLKYRRCLSDFGAKQIFPLSAWLHARRSQAGERRTQRSVSRVK